MHQPAARRWFEGLEANETVAFRRATQQSFLRLLANAAVLAPYGNQPLTNGQAQRHSEALLADSRVGFCIDEPATLEPRWKEFGTRPSPSPKLWMDAYLAAFAVGFGYPLVTTDRAFLQFSGLDVVVLGIGS